MNKQLRPIIAVIIIFFTYLGVLPVLEKISLTRVSDQQSFNAIKTESLITPHADRTPSIETISPALSPKEQNINEARRLVMEYDLAVKAEIQKGDFENHIDPHSGKEGILFKGESKERIMHFYDELIQRLQSLNQQYMTLYIIEVQPTPFPTKSTEQENEEVYQELIRQYPDFFDQLLTEGPTVQVYSPDEGIYYDMSIGDTYAKSEIMANAIETLHQAPIIAKIDQDAQIAQIRMVLEKPDLQLTFQRISGLANAQGIITAIYEDDAGTRYSVAIDKNILAAIEPEFRPDIPAAEVKPIEIIRLAAEKFAVNHSPRYAEMKSELLFEEGGKGDIYFFTWRFQNKDWSGTSWAMMPPFLQIGMSTDGKIVTYINTLDLYEGI